MARAVRRGASTPAGGRRRGERRGSASVERSAIAASEGVVVSPRAAMSGVRWRGVLARHVRRVAEQLDGGDGGVGRARRARAVFAAFATRTARGLPGLRLRRPHGPRFSTLGPGG